MLHFGIFLSVYLEMLTGAVPMTPISTDVQIAVGIFVLSHGFSLFYNFFYKGEYQVITTGQEMIQPYGRLLPMHFAILAVAFVAPDPTSQGFAIALLIIKLIIDVITHVFLHRGLARLLFEN